MSAVDNGIRRHLLPTGSIEERTDRLPLDGSGPWVVLPREVNRFGDAWPSTRNGGIGYETDPIIAYVLEDGRMIVER